MHKANLALLGLLLTAFHRHIVPQQATQPLLSIGQLCDAGYDMAFTVDCITIKHNNTIILQEHCMHATKLWESDIQPTRTTPNHLATTAIGSTTPADLVAFAHMALFSPALSTLTEVL